MNCPYCHKELQHGRNRRYETIGDHVTDPNIEEYPMRPTYVCDCAIGPLGWFGEDGFVHVTNREYFRYTDKLEAERK